MIYQRHQSEQDASVNFVAQTLDGGMLEARYVRRVPEYFICYLSSHTGCDKACRFCHLTQTGQTMMNQASIEEYLDQAEVVLKHYDAQGVAPAEWVNYNFMARGEPFENDVVLSRWAGLRNQLGALARRRGLRAQFNLSTIMPVTLGARSLRDVLGPEPLGTSVYYSLYSMQPEFRRRWLPKAMEPGLALRALANWQKETGSDVVLHWAFIEGQNDSLDDVDRIIDAVDKAGLKARFNLVRYNPFSERQGREPSEEVLERNFARLSTALGDPRSRIVPRVGIDVKASCGMFVERNT